MGFSISKSICCGLMLVERSSWRRDPHPVFVFDLSSSKRVSLPKLCRLIACSHPVGLVMVFPHPKETWMTLNPSRRSWHTVISNKTICQHLNVLYWSCVHVNCRVFFSSCALQMSFDVLPIRMVIWWPCPSPEFCDGLFRSEIPYGGPTSIQIIS